MSKKNKKSSGKKAPKKVIKAKKSSKKPVSKKKVIKKIKPAVQKKAKPVAKKKQKPVVKKKEAKVKVVAKKIVKVKVEKPAKIKAEKKIPLKAEIKKAAVVVTEMIKVEKVKAEVVKPLTKTEQKLHAKNVAKAQEKAKAFIAAKVKAGKQAQVDDYKPTNEPPGKFELEYVIHSSAELLFNFLTEPSGLSEWFCDDVNIRHGIYTFIWDGSSQQAKELKNIPEKLLRFQWVEKTDGSYFEFRIERDELTSDISLIITDFAETAEERNSSKLLWDSQIDKLLHVMGAYF